MTGDNKNLIARQISRRIRVSLEECGDVLTIDELASVLRTSRTTIKRRLRMGTFPIRPLTGIDRRRRWSRADVRRYFEGAKVR